MALASEWLLLGGLFLGVWTFVAREARLTILGYTLQTVCVAILYLMAALKTGDPMIWAAFAGISAIRAGFIPWLLHRRLPEDMLASRDARYGLTPAFAVVLYLALAAFGLLFGARLSAGPAGMSYGMALAALLTALTSLGVNHHAPKQIVGVLCADNAIDMIASQTLGRIAVVADYAVFVDVAVAVYLFSILVLRLRAHGGEDVRTLNELRG